MKYTITKEYRFEAAHSLPHLPLHHKCRCMHGHSYGLVVGVTGKLDKRDHWVQDYAEISSYVDRVIDDLDHKNLNEVMEGIPTTAENLALYIWKRLKRDLPMLCRIEVRETPTSNVILTK